MRKNKTILIISAFMIFLLVAGMVVFYTNNSAKSNVSTPVETATQSPEGQQTKPTQQGETMNATNTTTTPNNDIRITIGSRIFLATLRDDEAAQSFKAALPMTVQMADVNNNEKYFDLPSSLATNATNPGTIQTGDLMLYGTNTVVLFYKSFATSYSYTKLGSVGDPSGLEQAVGSGNVEVTFQTK